MPPKSLVKSMQAYARSLGNALERIDDILTRIPKEGATPRTVLSELENAKAIAEAKFEKMDANYDIQSNKPSYQSRVWQRHLWGRGDTKQNK